MTVREHETVTVRPDRIHRIEPQDPVPDRVHEWRKRHWRTWMAGHCLLNGVDGERANGVDRQLIQLRGCHRTGGPVLKGGGFAHVFASNRPFFPSFSAAALPASMR